jgi:hypothetical protein
LSIYLLSSGLAFPAFAWWNKQQTENGKQRKQQADSKKHVYRREFSILYIIASLSKCI